jgi:hypothetical protein
VVHIFHGDGSPEVTVKLKVIVVDWEMPPAAKRVALRIVLPAMVLAGASAIAYASVPKVWTAGEALKAADLNADFSSIEARIGSVEDGGLPGGLQSYIVPGNALVPPCAVVGGTDPVVDCTCPTGTYLVSGGAYVNLGGGYLRESEPLSTTTWRATCSSGSNDVLCGKYYPLCSRLSP